MNKLVTAFICNRSLGKSATKLIISQHSIIYKFRSDLKINIKPVENNCNKKSRYQNNK